MKSVFLPTGLMFAFLLNGTCMTQAAVEATPAAALPKETLLAAPPNGWTQIGGTQSGALKLAEYVPTAQLEANPEAARGDWKEKITLERLDGTPIPDPLEFLDGLRADHLASCSQGSYTPIAAAEENGYPTAVAMLECPKLSVTDAGQITLIKVIQGDEAFYTITRAMRARPWLRSPLEEVGDEKAKGDAKDEPKEDVNSAYASPPLPIDPTLIGGASIWLRAIKVCNPADPDHGCPAPASE